MNKCENRPKISVCVITYNHEKYIRQCLQSIVDQETDFDFEIIVGDDFSTDDTRLIVKGFANQYPDKIFPLFYDHKVGGTQNYVAVHNFAKGSYVAHIDGDDLAMPGKLQTQVDYLDKNPECSVVWHRMFVFDDADTFSIPNLPDLDMFKDGKVYLSDIFKFGSVSYHSSSMYRATARKTRIIHGEALDWSFNAEFLMSGYGKYLDLILGKYRLNPSTGITRTKKAAVNVRKLYVKQLENQLSIHPEYRHMVFINSTINFLVDVKRLRPTAWFFFKLSIKTFSLIPIREFVGELKRFRRINPAILK